MHAVVSSFWSHKAGATVAEYEDAYFPHDNGPRTADPMRIAVADGTSEGLLSGRWADLLVRTWCAMTDKPFDEILVTAVSAWYEDVNAYIEERKERGKPLQWFEESGLVKGAHATLLGVELLAEADASAHGSWTAVAVGDACLFHVRGEQLVASFPATSSSDFDNSPRVVPSRPADIEIVLDSVAVGRGEWRSRDRLYLLTDAIARWTLSEREAGRDPFSTFDGFDPDDPWVFQAWVETMRDHNGLRDDDVTVLRVGIL